jgi:hypothetical protein
LLVGRGDEQGLLRVWVYLASEKASDRRTANFEEDRTMNEQDYADGMADGLAGKPPDPDRLAYGANRLNDYERGYIDSGPDADPES